MWGPRVYIACVTRHVLRVDLRVTPINQQILETAVVARPSQRQVLQAEYSLKEHWRVTNPASALLELHSHRR